MRYRIIYLLSFVILTQVVSAQQPRSGGNYFYSHDGRHVTEVNPTPQVNRNVISGQQACQNPCVVFIPVPIYTYPIVPLYVNPMPTPVFEWISFNNVNAEGITQNRNRQYVQFQLGTCRDGKIWCRTMAMQQFFDDRGQALSWVSYMNQLTGLSVKNENPAGRIAIQR